RQDKEVRANFVHTRERSVTQGQKSIHTKLRQGNSNCSSNRCNGHALGQEKTSDTGATRTQRCTNCKLAATLGEMREQQVSDIGAGHEKENADGGKQDRQRDANTLGHLLLKWYSNGINRGDIRILPMNSIGDRAHVL